MELTLPEPLLLWRIFVRTWNKKVFGNIFQKKKHFLARLAGIQKSTNYPTSFFIHGLEYSLTYEFNSILKHENEFWMLKSSINWLMKGNRSTKFFPTSTLNRRRRNIITSLQENGIWLYDQLDIKGAIISFYKSLFTTDHQSGNHKCQKNTSNSGSISSSRHSSLDFIPGLEEIKKAVFSFKPSKAPVHDKMYPFMY